MNEQNKYQVEKGIPIPKPRRGCDGPGDNKYPWAGMEVGDSFFVERPIAQFAPIAYTRGKRHGERYVCRKEVKDGVEGTRIWRTA